MQGSPILLAKAKPAEASTGNARHVVTRFAPPQNAASIPAVTQAPQVQSAVSTEAQDYSYMEYASTPEYF
jgi:hypothetical protein